MVDGALALAKSRGCYVGMLMHLLPVLAHAMKDTSRFGNLDMEGRVTYWESLFISYTFSKWKVSLTNAPAKLMNSACDAFFFSLPLIELSSDVLVTFQELL